MKILIAVDDSRHSNAAVDFVRRMAWPKDTKAVVLSVVQPVVFSYAEVYVPAAPLGELIEDLTRIHTEVAKKDAESLRGAGLQVEAKVMQGDPRTTIVDAATQEKVDLVILGSHGRTGMAKLFMGSVASHVVTHATCSVLVVKL